MLLQISTRDKAVKKKRREGEGDGDGDGDGDGEGKGEGGEQRIILSGRRYRNRKFSATPKESGVTNKEQIMRAMISNKFKLHMRLPSPIILSPSPLSPLVL